MTERQADRVKMKLEQIGQAYDEVEVHHGVCVGADSDFHAMAKELDFFVVGHPGHPKGKPWDKSMRSADVPDLILEQKPFISRNIDIVSASHLVIACPASNTDKKGGTWTTIKMAMGEKPLYIVHHDGTVEEH